MKSQTFNKYGQLWSNDLLPDVLENLKIWGLHPDKKFSQNFLCDSEVYLRIREYARPFGVLNALEIGSGLGILTRSLSQLFAHVVTIERDTRLNPFLVSSLHDISNIRIVEMDALDTTVSHINSWFSGPYAVIANLPYAITGAFIRIFTQFEIRPSGMVLLVQKEVGTRITALPGNLSLIALAVQMWGTAEYLETIPKEVFYPIPRVESAIVRFQFSPELYAIKHKDDEKDFWRYARIGFSNPRKTLMNNLLAGNLGKRPYLETVLNNLEIPLKARPQELSVNDWVALFRELKNKNTMIL